MRLFLLLLLFPLPVASQALNERYKDPSQNKDQLIQQHQQACRNIFALAQWEKGWNTRIHIDGKGNGIKAWYAWNDKKKRNCELTAVFTVDKELLSYWCHPVNWSTNPDNKASYPNQQMCRTLVVPEGNELVFYREAVGQTGIERIVLGTKR